MAVQNKSALRALGNVLGPYNLSTEIATGKILKKFQNS